MLNEAWKKKFLDLTMVRKLKDQKYCAIDLTLHNFNPFNMVYHNVCYFPGRQIFPNKLKNMCKYPLKVSLIPRPPSVNFEKDSSGKPINMNGTEYAAMALLSRKLNFTIDWKTPNVKSYNEPFGSDGKTILDMIVRGEFEFGANQIYLHLALKDKLRQGERSVATYVDEYCALVPVFHVPTWVIGNEILEIMATAVAYVLVTYCLVRILRFDARYWPPHYALQILLGNASPRAPTRTFERFFFIALMVSSMRFSGFLYAKMTDINLLQLDQGPFFEYSDLASSDLTLEMRGLHKEMTFYDVAEPWLAELEKKVDSVDDVMKCPAKLLENKNVACLMDRTMAEAFLANETHESHHRPRMKIMQPCFWSASKGCIFSEASPYVNEFNEVIQRIYETGLWMRWSLENKTKRLPGEHQQRNRLDDFGGSDSFLRKKLTIVWVVGCTVACVAFLSEFIVKYTNE